MKRSLWNVTKNDQVVKNLEIAGTPWDRMRGLLGRARLAEDAGLFLEDCSSIHTCFMRFPIDVVFLGEDLRVVKVVRDLQPWGLVRASDARHVLELPAGASARCRLDVRDQLQVQVENLTPPVGPKTS
ncbi:MAG: DUF192 domain-containing protein [Planctomycetes bacterium]|nr:DUF192 domain-containing protein [Planctomycetota bacterium]